MANTKNGWSEERRKKQAEAIRRWKPWEKSTGPKTARGKESSSLNALKHGARSRAKRQYSHLIKLNRAFLETLLCLYKHDHLFASVSNKLMEKEDKSKAKPPPTAEKRPTD